MNRREFLNRSLFVALGLASGVGLVGCGTNRQTSGEVSPAKAKPTFKIGYLPITDHLTMIAHGQTEFRQFVLEPVKFSNWAELAEALKGEKQEKEVHSNRAPFAVRD